MKLIRDLTKYFDGSLLIIVALTVILGFGIAHWNGLRVSDDSPSNTIFKFAAYEISFGQGAGAVLVFIISIAFIAGVATMLRIHPAERLAVQFIIASGIFSILNLMILAIWTSKAAVEQIAALAAGRRCHGSCRVYT